ncbi:unnamed protein product [Ceutorhynchus assimilis]|uniref:oleoyl-[acyl-carrier-protein] hydrolase n=1 Tax=Ceutorhynchus assimilis TaxID=467358 RepID=A0A9N9MYU6_9CUCU|nr:unnamed protein product [Ceutorhynchus assimilis]
MPSKENVDLNIEFGRLLANPPEGDEIVISGISGKYPDSDNIHEFRDNLFNKVDMVSPDSRRWEPGHPEIPQRTGKVPNIANFDAGFFGVHHRQATAMDPMIRMFLENTVAALFDAGIHPSELEGTNTGVFVGSCFSENEKCWFFDKLLPQSFAITGCERSMIANRISYFFKLKGPSFITDTACSSSLYAFEHAYKAVREGKCDRAIVGGTNICLHPFVSLQFSRLGVLSKDGSCKAFDKNCNGYARSEAISCIILQKAKESKRVYCTIMHAKTNCDGYKDSGITYPSGEMQVKLLSEFYQECSAVKPTDLSYLEAHGTGTKVGDPEELQAVEEVFLKNRNTPLLIGSVKSNIGHAEPSSGLCSIAKAIIATETGYIPPNLHYNEPNPNVKALLDGRLKVVTEKIPFNDNKGIIGINSFGFGGGNCHVLLKQNTKPKVNYGRAKDNIPRLVCVSGRTKEAVNALLEDVIENRVDVEHVRLLQESFRKTTVGHLYRGYILASKSGEMKRSFNYSAAKAPSLIVCFGKINDIMTEKIKAFMEVPLVAGTIYRIHQALDLKSINITDILLKPKLTTTLDKVLSNFTIQMIFADLVKALDLQPSKFFGINKGLSLGILVSAYFDAAITLNEAVECAFAIASAANSVSKNDGTDSNELGNLVEKSGTVATNLQQALTRILSKPRRFSKRVIFDASPPEMSSVYLINSFGRTKVFNDVKATLNEDFAIYEIGNGDSIDTLQKHFTNTHENFFLNVGEDLNGCLSSLGKLYELGLNPQISNIYPKIDFPVSRGTPMISPKIKWNHAQKWWVTLYKCDEQMEVEERTIGIMLKDPAYSFMGGHVIDGRNLFPATGYLQFVWETLAFVHGLMISDMRVVFENCKFMRACSIPKEGSKLDLTVMVQRGTGNFEVVEGGSPVVSGRIRQVTAKEMDLADIPLPTGVPKHVAPYLDSKDIYKELRLRGYNYKGKFRSLKSCDNSCQVAEVTWDGNWITFIDNLLQIKILQEDTRMLYVPTSIQKLFIDAKRHLEYVKTHTEENPCLPIHISKPTGIIRSGGIEIKGLNASSIARRKYLGTPVLEKYMFMPDIAELKTEQAIRINMQILLENLYSIKVKAVELIDDATMKGVSPLGEIVHDVLADQPLIQPDITILSKEELSIKHVKVEDKKLLTEVDCSLVVASKILQRPNILQLVFGSIKENGFVLSREPLDFDVASVNNGSQCIVTVFTTEKEQLVFFKKKIDFKAPKVIKISSEDKDFKWLPKLKDSLETNPDVLVYSQGEPLNGILGLVACIRREPGGQNLKLVFLPDGSCPPFDPTDPFYKQQLEKNLAINIFKDSTWGTYRHLLLEQTKEIQADHCYLNSLQRGDLTSLKWIEGPLHNDSQLGVEKMLVSIYYAALNFRDVMTASGRINVDSITRDRREQECVQGFEFSGRTPDGRRVMGMVTNGACATLLDADPYLLMNVPDSWSLEEAATVPVVYQTCIYALINRGRLKRGDSVLVHSGTGGIGQAAISLALHIGCTVYTTVGTQEKRAFLKKRFPQLTDKNISSSRDINFEKHIFNVTNGRGVDVVLNSLAEEKLFASVRCLARGGRFVEIGKYDLANDNTLNLLLISKDASFHGVMLDSLFAETPAIKASLVDHLNEAIRCGAIRPLNRTTFKMNQAEEAFRFMGTGKHTGKVLIQIRKEEKENIVTPSVVKFMGLPRYFCDSEKTYIICGGLGGFGLELADWLTLRGCRKLILTSRNGIKTGYQAYRINIWRTYGCKIEISTEDITTYEGCSNLVKTANQLGPVHAIFNLAVVLRDSILQNQTEDDFKISFGPKAYATEHLDKVSRKHCPELRDFVIFSSVSCGRGNAGQSNYGMANSVMERIIEKRQTEGLPALAIEWGAVGDVGLVAEMQNEAIEMEIGGTLQQRISNCLQVMDIFLRQQEAAIVSSIVVAEKRAGAAGADNIVDAVANILGIQDLKAISLQATLAEAGMDSMNAVEIKQTLEREYEVFLTAQDIKSMTFARLIEIQSEKVAEAQAGVKKGRPLMGMDMILRLLGDEKTANMPVVSIHGKASESAPTVVIFPGIEGTITVLEPLYKNLVADLVGLQYPNSSQRDSIKDMAKECLPFIEERLSRSKPFNIICYSFGGTVALEAVALLEQKGYLGTVICIDSSPDYLQALTRVLEVESDDKFQVSLICHLMSLQISYEIISKHVESLLKLNSFEERIKLAQQIVGNSTPHSPEHQRDCAISIYKRIKAVVDWSPDFKLKSKVILFKPVLTSIEIPDEDYGLSKFCENPVEVRVFEGNHASVLDNVEVALAANELFDVTETAEENKGKGDLIINLQNFANKVPTKN